MSPNSKLLGALLVVWAVLFATAATANAQNGHHHSGGHASADHHRVGSESHRQSTNHDRVGSRETPNAIPHRPSGGHHQNHSSGQYCPDNFYSPTAPGFQPIYRPISSFNPAPNYNRSYDPHRYDDDRDARRTSSPNPGIGRWWPVMPVMPVMPNRRAQRIAAVKARVAAKPVAAVVKKPILDLPEPELRTWTDDTGRHTTSARFVGMLNQNVILRKLDNSQVELPLDRLSVADHEWIESRRSAR